MHTIQYLILSQMFDREDEQIERQIRAERETMRQQEEIQLKEIEKNRCE